MSHSSQRPAYYIEDCRIFILFFVKDQLRCHHNYDGMISSQINGSDVDNRATVTKIDADTFRSFRDSSKQLDSFCIS